MMRSRKTFGRLGLAIAGIAAIGGVAVAGAVQDLAAIDGTYAGTFVCSRGEMGMTLSVKILGPAKQDMIGEPCRSGSGPCNDAQNARLARMREIGGVLNFFPTAANPDTPAGAFRVSGSAETIGDGIAIRLEPGEWIEKPERWGSAAMTATLTGNTMAGKPIAPGCETLLMRKISE